MLNRNKANDLLNKTINLINGERAKSYGEPQESFEHIARYWANYLGIEIDEQDVGMMMILLKIARNQANHSLDNYIDICGYASLIGSKHVTNSK